jgi:UDP-glucose 4-epimerase
MQKALISGATGFIGQHLCRALQAKGVTVLALGRKPCVGPWDDFVAYDFASGEPFLASVLANVDTVFHLASKAHALSETPGSEDGYHEVIVDGTRRLLEAAITAPVKRFIYLSSVKAMGDAGFRKPQKEPISEDDGEWTSSVKVAKSESGKVEDMTKLPPSHLQTNPPSPHLPTFKPSNIPTSPYGRAKAAAERLVLESALPHVAILRPTMVYGPGQKGNLERMAEAIRKHRFPPIAENGNQRSIVHVNNVVAACIAAAEQTTTHGKAYILAESPPRSTRQLYDRLRVELGMSPTRLAIPNGLLLAMAKIGDLLGFISRRRMPLDSDSVWKLLGSAWYDGRAIEQDTDFRYEKGLALLGD